MNEDANSSISYANCQAKHSAVISLWDQLVAKVQEYITEVSKP